MMRTMHLLQGPVVEVRVDLGRRNIGVSQQILDRYEIGSALKQMRGESVAKRVG
jgi:hypothetical protein